MEWAKCYETHPVSGVYQERASDAHRKLIFRIAGCLADQMDEIKWEERLNAPLPIGLFQGVNVAVDTTPFELPKSDNLHYNGMYYSPHYHMCCLRYEMGVKLTDSRIVWWKGPIRGARHDAAAFREFGMSDHLLAGECVLGDFGYRGLERVVTPFHQADPALNHRIYSARVVIEQVNGRLADFGCLDQVWRHSIEHHLPVAHVLAHVSNMKLVYQPIRALGPNPYLFQ